jgi:epoxyqueuosine reductase
MDARRCISYLTIELRGSIPAKFRQAIGRNVYGCDICQDVCPWNNDAPLSTSIAFQPVTIPLTTESLTPLFSAQQSAPNEIVPVAPSSALNNAPKPAEESRFLPRLEWLASMTEEDFRRIFQHSAIKRTKWRGLVRNACIALGNSEVRPGTPAFNRVSNILNRLRTSPDPVIVESAQWALARIQQGQYDSSLDSTGGN